MILRRSSFAIQNKNAKDLNHAKDYPTLADLIKEQNIPDGATITVHHRRDLDSLG